MPCCRLFILHVTGRAPPSQRGPQHRAPARFLITVQTPTKSVPPSWLSSLSDDDGGHDFRAAASSVVELRNQSSSSVASTHHEHCRQAIFELRFARLRVNMLLARSFQCMVLTNVAPFWYTALHCDVPAVHGGCSAVHSLAFLTEESRFLRPLSL